MALPKMHGELGMIPREILTKQPKVTWSIPGKVHGSVQTFPLEFRPKVQGEAGIIPRDILTEQTKVGPKFSLACKDIAWKSAGRPKNGPRKHRFLQKENALHR